MAVCSRRDSHMRTQAEGVRGHPRPGTARTAAPEPTERLVPKSGPSTIPVPHPEHKSGRPSTLPPAAPTLLTTARMNATRATITKPPPVSRHDARRSSPGPTSPAAPEALRGRPCARSLGSSLPARVSRPLRRPLPSRDLRSAGWCPVPPLTDWRSRDRLPPGIVGAGATVIER
jgi:hypothetical protein